MPTLWETDGTRVDFSLLPSHTWQVRDTSSEQASALPDGERALTPIIAGVISGTCIALAWLVALIHILVKRHRRKQRYKQLGQDADSKRMEQAEEERRRKEFIVPPDPAVLEGTYKPGERLVVKRERWWKRALGAVSGRGWRMGRKTSEGELGTTVGGSRKEKGKGKETPTPPRGSTTDPHRTSVNRYTDDACPDDIETITIIPPEQTENNVKDRASSDIVEEMELRPVPLHSLSTLISVTDLEGFRSRSGTPSSHLSPSQAISPEYSRRSSETRSRRSNELVDKNVNMDHSKSRGDVSKVVDFATSDPDRDDLNLVDHDNGNATARVHKYPPARLR